VTKFNVKAVLYQKQGSTPRIWTDDLLNPLTAAYINLSQSFCQLVLDSLRLGNPTIAKDAICHKVVFTRIILFRLQKRQAGEAGNSTENTTQGVQGNSEVQLVSPNATDINETEFNNILISGYNQSNASSELQLFGVEATVVIPDTTTTQLILETTMQTQSVELTSGQNTFNTESQTITGLSTSTIIGK
ncbi:hypothetical protein KSF78_0009576, partial [Schistosoma japonicum]